MSSNTAKAGLTYPALSDPPNIPSNLQTLAGQLDGMVIPTYASSTAQNTANPTPKAGDICFRSDLKSYQTYDGFTWLSITQGVWNTYTPTWTATANPAIGNGTLEGKYALVGKLCTVRIGMVAGSTTTFGTGEWKFALPFAAAAAGNANFGWVGSASGVRTGVAYNPGTCRILSGASIAQIISSTAADGSTNAQWSPSVPFTWASTNILSLTIAYEIA